MRQRLVIIITIVVVLGVLIALNAASYVSAERTRDSELYPDRSTYNSGATGTRALYEFLVESGYKATRWRESPAELLKKSGQERPSTFVVVGETITPFKTEEAESLLRWVRSGGRLVIIDRNPNPHLLPAAGDWQVTMQLLHYPSFDNQPPNADEMTAGVTPARAAQPTILTRGVETVLQSRLAARINISSRKDEKQEKQPKPGPSPQANEDVDNEDEPPPPPAPKPTPSPVIRTMPRDEPPVGYGPGPPPRAEISSPTPVVHVSSNQGPLLVDYPHGAGRIIILSDPFIITNIGINRADNLPLAINLLARDGGLIAFDEYHQGRSVAQNEVAAYFAGTPLVAALGQFALIVFAVLWTNGRRFARPLPVPQVDRRSTLEFVASMAELQQRSRAYDLAIENIYTRLRRVLARYAGVSNNSPRSLIAAGVAVRSGLDREQLEKLMHDCEDAINGEPVDARRSLALVANLRQLESDLGLRMRSREIRQAKEK